MVSETGLGTWALSGSAYGPANDDESIKTINEALDGGFNFIDTADSYGMGRSEALVGKVLSERKDKNTIIATKFGWDFYRQGGIKGNLKRDYIEFALEESLKRLNRETVDIYLIHSQNPENIKKHDVIKTLEDLKQKGKIRYFGLSARFPGDVMKVLEFADLDVIEIKYNLVSPEAQDKLFRNLSANRPGIICREALSNGFLSGRYSVNSVFPKTDHRNGLRHEEKELLLDKIEKVRFLQKKNRSLTQAGIDFCKSNKFIDVTLTGPKNRSQLKEFTNSEYEKLTKNELERIEHIQADWI